MTLNPYRMERQFYQGTYVQGPGYPKRPLGAYPVNITPIWLIAKVLDLVNNRDEPYYEKTFQHKHLSKPAPTHAYVRYDETLLLLNCYFSVHDCACRVYRISPKAYSKRFSIAIERNSLSCLMNPHEDLRLTKALAFQVQEYLRGGFIDFYRRECNDALVYLYEYTHNYETHYDFVRNHAPGTPR